MVRLVRIMFVFVFATLIIAVASFAAEANSDASAESGDASEASASSNAGSSSASSAAQSSAPSPASTFRSKLQVHGFLSQAWVTGSFVGNRFPGPGGVDPGPTFEERALGIPEDGTFDYRTLALQFRYEISPKDIMVIQLSSRELGDSPISDREEEVELDWAFYERRLTDSTSLKVGRVQIPLGIFNEIRDVGTILPFYRPSFIFYREGTFTSETVDGLVLSHNFWSESDWNLEVDLFAGDWDTLELTPVGGFTEEVTIAKDEGYGVQLWLNTPLPGLRFGFGGHHRDRTGGAEGIIREPGATTRFDDWYASVDAVFERFVFRAEFRQFEGDPEVSPAFLATDFSSTIDLYYAQIGYHFNDKFRIYLQAEINDNELNASIFTRSFDVSLRDDFGIAFNYLFTPNLVLKAEYHEVGGEDFTALPVFGPGGLQLDPLVRDLDEGDYTILSLSTSF